MTGKRPRAPRGMRDLLPAAMRRRQFVIGNLRETFESYGFEPFDTPAMEESATLLGKYGPDAERLIYGAGLQGKSDLALRYDLSVPLARVCAGNDAIPRPFRRYQIGPVWRGERPQRGRYREFVQADVDIVGSDSLLADAEIIAVTRDGLASLGFRETLTKVNNRRLLNAIGEYAGVPTHVLPGLYRAIDKLDKVGLEGVRQELKAVGLPADLLNRQRQAVDRWLRGQADRERLQEDLAAAVPSDAPPEVVSTAIPAFLDALPDVPNSEGNVPPLADARLAAMEQSITALRRIYPADDQLSDTVTERLLDLLQLSGSSRDVLAELESRLDSPEAASGVREMTEVLDALGAAGMGDEACAVDFAMVRGLEYYTGTIFETIVTQPAVGSITGGGRYDRLIGLFGRELPAVGTSFGVDRLVDVMDELGMFPEWVDGPTAEVVVARFDESTTAAALALAARLRAWGLRTETNLSTAGLGSQIRDAVRRSIPVMAIIGPDEAAAGAATVKDLRRQSQRTLPVEEVAAAVADALLEGSDAADSQ